MLAGAIAGVPVSLLACPTELLKCRLQAQGGALPPPGAVYSLSDVKVGLGAARRRQVGGACSFRLECHAVCSGRCRSATNACMRPARCVQAGRALFRGPVGVMRSVMTHEGGLLGLYRGLVPTLLREVPGNAGERGDAGLGWQV